MSLGSTEVVQGSSGKHQHILGAVLGSSGRHRTVPGGHWGGTGLSLGGTGAVLGSTLGVAGGSAGPWKGPGGGSGLATGRGELRWTPGCHWEGWGCRWDATSTPVCHWGHWAALWDAAPAPRRCQATTADACACAGREEAR